MASSNNIFFNELKNITEDNVVKIFSKGKNASIFKPNEGEKPTIIILVGSPGVGKTSTAKKIIPLIVGDKYSYNNFYNIALDSLVEHVRPYREVTHSIYKELTKYKNGKLNNSNADFLSTMYLNTIMSTSQNFNLNSTRKKKI
jgi:Cdc6-like AAA superfamily ATPase